MSCTSHEKLFQFKYDDIISWQDKIHKMILCHHDMKFNNPISREKSMAHFWQMNCTSREKLNSIRCHIMDKITFTKWSYVITIWNSTIKFQNSIMTNYIMTRRNLQNALTSSQDEIKSWNFKKKYYVITTKWHHEQAARKCMLHCVLHVCMAVHSADSSWALVSLQCVAVCCSIFHCIEVCRTCLDTR